MRVLDGKVRGGFLKQQASGGLKRRSSVAQAAGESHIDNTVLPNILTKGEARVLLAGSLIKSFAVKFVARKQRKILARLAARGCCNIDLFTAPPKASRCA